jgi:hypothetical protein
MKKTIEGDEQVSIQKEALSNISLSLISAWAGRIDVLPKIFNYCKGQHRLEAHNQKSRNKGAQPNEGL